MPESLIDRDSILLWDTDASGRVSLSSGRGDRFRRKVRAAHLLGGTVLVRPAELFEGPHVLESATHRSGDLLNLLRAGRAKVVLEAGDDLWRRLEKKFDRENVFHQGREIKSRREIDRLRSQLHRVCKRLEKLGWNNARQFHSQDLVTSRDRSLRNALERVGKRFWGQRFEQSRLARSIRERASALESRSVFYPYLEQWAAELPGSEKQSFLTEAMGSMTWCSIEALANDIGCNVSEIRAPMVLNWTFGTEVADSVAFSGSCWRAAAAVVRALRQRLPPADWQRSVAARYFEAGTGDFIRWSDGFSAQDRTQARRLLFEASSRDILAGRSLVEAVHDLGANVPERQLDRLAEARIEELQEFEADRLRKVGFLWEQLPAILLPVYSQVLAIAEGVALLCGKKLPGPLSGETPVLVGLRKSQW